MVKMVTFMFCVFYHNKKTVSDRDNKRTVGAWLYALESQ